MASLTEQSLAPLGPDARLEARALEHAWDLTDEEPGTGAGFYAAGVWTPPPEHERREASKARTLARRAGRQAKREVLP